MRTEYKLQTRGSKAIVGMRTADKNGQLARLRLVTEDEGLMVITDGGQVIRTRIAEIRETGRNTQGVIVIRLKDGENVVDVEPVQAEDAEDEATEEGAEGTEATAEGSESAAAEEAEGTAAEGAEGEGESPAGE